MDLLEGFDEEELDKEELDRQIDYTMNLFSVIASKALSSEPSQEALPGYCLGSLLLGGCLIRLFYIKFVLPADRL